jgi:hypothetical protein
MTEHVEGDDRHRVRAGEPLEIAVDHRARVVESLAGRAILIDRWAGVAL